MSGGVLVLAATPIGDPRDAAPRLADELRAADVVAAEDTRRLRRLCQDLDVNPTGRVLSFHEHNEAERTTELARRLNVSLALLEAWMRGDTTMPDGKWMDLARVLDRISREQRAMGRSGS